MPASSKGRYPVQDQGRAPFGVTAGEEEIWRLPSTVSRAPLLEEDGSDRRFRQLVADLLTISARMQQVREHLAARMGISGAQYSVLMAIAQLQGDGGTAVGVLAKQLHVSSAFIATETGKLAQAGLVCKRPNQKDRRGVLLMVTRNGRARIERYSGEIREINDAFFGSLDPQSFQAMSGAIADLVRSSDRAVRRLYFIEPATEGFGEAAK